MEKLNFDNLQIDRSLPTLSISACLGLLSKPFDADKAAEASYNKHYNNSESEYYHKTKEEIIEIWQNKGADSCRYGSMLDDYIGLNLTGSKDDIELWKLDNDYDGDERLHGNCDSFDAFISLFLNDDIEFVTREKTVYIPHTNDNNEVDGYFKGRFDALFYNKKTKKYIIVDWKSSATIAESNRWDKLLGPCRNLDACNYNTYTLQGYFYKKSLIEHYLPKGTKEDDVVFMIVQLPGHVINEGAFKGQNFATYRPAFAYDDSYISNMLSFAWKKNALLNK